jgi:hypothetical protein
VRSNLGAGVNLLMVGFNKAPGSWDIRGLQLGRPLGARMTSTPDDSDWGWADVAVLIKHAGHKYAAQARAAGVPVVWDALDFWQQPRHNDMSEDVAKRLIQETIAVIQPARVVGATQAMAAAAGGDYLPHHSWRGLEPVQPQTAVTTVGYQGNAAFLGRWAGWLLRAAERRQWRVVLNPEQLWTADILVALRDGPWDGWMCREWKSGVKLVNAIAAGRPVIRQPSAASREIGAPGSIVETADDLEVAFDVWASRSARHDAFEQCRALAPAYRLPAVAEQYRAILQTVRAACPA